MRVPVPRVLSIVLLLLAGGYYVAARVRPSVTKLSGGDQVSETDSVFRLLNRGTARLEQYEYKLAAAEFRKARQLDPRSLPALIDLAIALYYDSDMKSAEESLRTALNIDPALPNAHFLLGLVLSHDTARTDESVAEFRKVEARFPEDVGTLYNLGLAQMRLRSYNEAIEKFKKVLSIEPRHMSALWNLSMSFMRSGRREEGRQALDRLRETSGGEQPAGMMGTRYDEEGRFAAAMALPLAEAASPPSITVKFRDASGEAGLLFTDAGKLSAPGATIEIDRSSYSVQWAEANLVTLFGSGAAFFDYNRDGRPDIYIVNGARDGTAPNALYRNEGGGKFTDVSKESGAGLAGRGTGVAAGDYDNDGFTDIYLTRFGRNVLLHNEGNGVFKDVSDVTGVAGGERDWSLSAAFIDVDHDGDLDLYVCNFASLDVPAGNGRLRFPDDFPGQPNRLFRNDGNGKFTEIGDPAGVAGRASKSTSVIATDFNETRDVDLLVLNYKAPPFLYRNNRDGTFTDVAAAAGLATLPGVIGLSVADMDGDGYPDIALPPRGKSSAASLLRNREGRAFDPPPSSPGPHLWEHPGQAAAIDFDNDGLVDVVTSDGTSLRLFRNNGPGRPLSDVSVESGLTAFDIPSPGSLAVADYDGDSDSDLLVTRRGRRPLLLRNDGGNSNRALRLSLEALKDNRSAFGTKIEVRAGALRRKLEWTGGCGYLTQGSGDFLVGLGRRKVVDAVRVLWPSGVLQSELDPPSGSTFQVQQLDRKGTSCPILYAWNGRRYEFVTDFLGGSAIGSLVAPGRYNETDPDEYVLVSSSQLKARDDSYSIKMNNQLEEVLFIDRARLWVVDHPAGVRVYPNERLMPGPPFPDFLLFVVDGASSPLRAVDGKGRDETESVRWLDRRWPEDFKILPFKGYAETHTLELDFGEVPESHETVLLLDAWIDYADSSSNLAASQAGVTLSPPRLEMADSKGRWVPIVESMGFPAGLPKTMTVDLSGKLLPTRTLRLRIVTNMRIYWDRILLASKNPRSPIHKTALAPASARLGWGGYPLESSDGGKGPKSYDYGRREEAAPWKTHAGAYTRYGDVTELLDADDDMYVIMRHGDEISVEFDSRSLPPLAEGWDRTFLVYASGFGKDMDVNSAWPETVLPLPFHAMRGYPIPVPYPADERHSLYMEKYNTRRYPGFLFGVTRVPSRAVESDR